MTQCVKLAVCLLLVMVTCLIHSTCVMMSLFFVGATGTSFANTTESNVAKHDEAMKKDPKNWSVAVDCEHDGMVTDHEAFEGAPRDEVPDDKLVVSSTWATKQKPRGKKRARVNARGF